MVVPRHHHRRSHMQISRKRILATKGARGDEDLIRRRFFDLISPEPNSGCWLWMGTLNNYGYGRFGNEQAHVVSLRYAGNEVPLGLEPDHLCRVRCCVNPLHLEPVTHRVNMLRGNTVAAISARNMNCPKGHPLTKAHFRTRKPGYHRRICRICKAEADRHYYLRKKGKAA
jgi:hypothetical protein